MLIYNSHKLYIESSKKDIHLDAKLYNEGGTKTNNRTNEKATTTFEQTSARKSNRIVHDIRCHAIQVLGLSKIESLNKFTPKSPRE